jgi:soluble lytic murein transglycosylase-like protein
MSIRLTDTLYTPGLSPLKREPDAVKPNTGGTSFLEKLAAAAGKGTSGKIGRPVAMEAEFLHLAMMRNALSLDSSPASPTVAADWMKTLLNASAAGEQNNDALATVPTSTESPAIAGPALPQAAGAPVALPIAVAPTASGSGTDSSIAAVIGRASRRYGVHEGLIKAVIHAESNFKPTAVSPAGAQGLMQLMPATAAGLGVTDSFNPEQNVMAGTRFLKDLLNRYGGDLDKALAAYNWGPGNVDRGKSRLPLETREYLVKVKKLYAAYSIA